MKVYEKLAQRIAAYHSCVKSGNVEWERKHADSIMAIVDSLPHGSGIDGCTAIDFDKSNGKTVISIDSEYHYMDDNGFYAGWLYFTITLTANLSGSPDYNFDIWQNDADEDTAHLDDLLGDYLVEIFSYALSEESADL